MDVDFFTPVFNKAKAIREIDEFVEYVRKHGNYRWKEEFTEGYDNMLTVFFYKVDTDETVLAFDFREGDVDIESLNNGMVDVRRTLADKICNIFRGEYIRKRMKDVVDVATISTFYKGRISLKELKRLVELKAEKRRIYS